MRSTIHPDAIPATSQAAPAAAPEATAPAATATEAVTKAVDNAAVKSKQWLNDFDVNQLAGQLPQSVRDLGTRVASRVRGLTPVQQALGGTALAFGLGFLVVRSRRNDRTADAKASKKYRAKFEGKPFKGRGKAKYAGS